MKQFTNYTRMPDTVEKLQALIDAAKSAGCELNGYDKGRTKSFLIKTYDYVSAYGDSIGCFKSSFVCVGKGVSYDEFISQFRTQNQRNNMKTITSKQAQSIIDVACGEWKKKLALKWAYYIVKGDDIDIEDGFYKEMRKACTADQHKLFDEIFGKDKGGAVVLGDKIDKDSLINGYPVAISYGATAYLPTGENSRGNALIFNHEKFEMHTHVYGSYAYIYFTEK